MGHKICSPGRSQSTAGSGGSPSSAPPQGTCCAGNGRTDGHAKCPTAARSQVLERRRDPSQSAGAFLYKSQSLALQRLRCSLWARRGQRRAAASGSFKPFGPRQHRHRPPMQETAAAPRRGSAEGCGQQAAHFHCGRPRAGLVLPAVSRSRSPQTLRAARHGTARHGMLTGTAEQRGISRAQHWHSGCLQGQTLRWHG